MSMKIPQIFAKQRNKTNYTRPTNNSSSKNSNNKQLDKTKMTQNIFMIVMCVIVAFSPCGVGLYWFLNSFFSVGQSYLIHRLILRKRKMDRDNQTVPTNFKIE